MKKAINIDKSFTEE